MTLFTKPCEGRVTSHFQLARKNPVTGVVKAHKGIDYGADGSPIIKAAAPGTVTRATVIGGYGNTVTIAHVIGGVKYETLYAHLKSIVVKVGQAVKVGQQIGVKGATGNSTGVHLHFEIHKPSYAPGQPNAVDPFYLTVDPDVVALQKLLVQVGYDIKSDGILGASTTAAVTNFQKKNNLAADGIAGVQTVNKLKVIIDQLAKLKEDIKVVEQQLTAKQEELRKEAMELGITDGNDPFRQVTQLYVWSALVPVMRKVKDLEEKMGGK